MFSKKKLLELWEEESKTSKEYARNGFKSFAKDEAKHAAFFKMLAKKGGK